MNENELKTKLLNYFDENMFNYNLQKAKQLGNTTLIRGINLTRARLSQRTSKGIIHFYWSAVSGTEKSIPFSNEMKQCGLIRFEDLLEDFRVKFKDCIKI